MEESGENPENSKAVTKSAASAARKVKAKQTRALDILKRDTGIVESTTPSRVGSFILIHTFEAKPIPFHTDGYYSTTICFGNSFCSCNCGSLNVK